MKTMICLILDRSGSMGGRENDVINGINSFIDEQKKLPDPASIAFVRFDSEAIERFRPMQNLTEVKHLTRGEYQPRGGTPLLDAVGQSIVQLEEDWKAEKPERAIVVIVTDGEENSSKEFTKAKIQALIKARQDSGMWAFIYLGANVDAFAEANSMGIATANAAGYVNTARGTKTLYETASASVHHMRSTGHTFAHNLGRNIGEDEEAEPAKSIPIASPVVAQQPAMPSVSIPTWVPPAGAAVSQPSGTWTPPA